MAGAELSAGAWKVKVYEEQCLAEGRLSKGAMEFFLVLLRAVCSQLHLPLALGSQKLGLLARATENPAVFLEIVRGWTSWSCLAEEIKRARELLVPVCLDDNMLPRDCVYAVVTAAEAGQTLGAARLLRVVVHDAIGRPHCARGLAQNLEMLVRGAVGCGERAGSVGPRLPPHP